MVDLRPTGEGALTKEERIETYLDQKGVTGDARHILSYALNVLPNYMEQSGMMPEEIREKLKEVGFPQQFIDNPAHKATNPEDFETEGPHFYGEPGKESDPKWEERWDK